MGTMELGGLGVLLWEGAGMLVKGAGMWARKLVLGVLVCEGARILVVGGLGRPVAVKAVTLLSLPLVTKLLSLPLVTRLLSLLARNERSNLLTLALLLAATDSALWGAPLWMATLDPPLMETLVAVEVCPPVGAVNEMLFPARRL